MVTFGPYIIPLPKSDHLTVTDNYRGISLTCIVAKMFNRMMLNRLRPAIDPLLRKNQNGFREGRSKTSQILVLRRVIEEVKLNNLSAVITFIDFKLEVLIEKGSAAVSCDANRTKTVCRTVEHINFFLKVNNIEL